MYLCSEALYYQVYGLTLRTNQKLPILVPTFTNPTCLKLTSTSVDSTTSLNQTYLKNLTDRNLLTRINNLIIFIHSLIFTYKKSQFPKKTEILTFHELFKIVVYIRLSIRLPFFPILLNLRQNILHCDSF